MPGDNIYDWSTTDSSNANSDSNISWVDGMPRATVKLSGRSIMAAVAKQRNIVNGTITTGGSANAQTFTTTMSYGTVPTGMVIRAKVGFTNTGSATLNLDAIGAVTIKNQHGDTLAPGELLAGTYATFLYNGTNWILLDGNCGVSPMALINKQTTTATSIQFTGLTNDYTYYRLDIAGLTFVNTGLLKLRASTNNGVSYDTGTNYYNGQVSVFLGGTPNSNQNVASAALFLSASVDNSNSSETVGGHVDIYNAGSSVFPVFNSQMTNYHQTTFGIVTYWSGGFYSGGAMNAFQIFPDGGGNMTGTFSLYGIR
jgi:hypothetical protein